jgi:hypothetical protein
VVGTPAIRPVGAKIGVVRSGVRRLVVRLWRSGILGYGREGLMNGVSSYSEMRSGPQVARSRVVRLFRERGRGRAMTESFVARFTRDDIVAGTGVFLGFGNKVMTDAIVVNRALRRNAACSVRPGDHDVVELDFPFAYGEGSSVCRASVVKWSSPRDDSLATLKILNGVPPGVTPVLLAPEYSAPESFHNDVTIFVPCEASDLCQEHVRMDGQPRWGQAELNGVVTANGRSLWQSARHEPPTESNLLGSPVKLRDERAVVGIIVGKMHPPRGIRLINAATMVRYLKDYIWRRSTPGYLLDAFHRRCMTAFLVDLANNESEGLEGDECDRVYAALRSVVAVLSQCNDLAYYNEPLHTRFDRIADSYFRWNKAADPRNDVRSKAKTIEQRRQAYDNLVEARRIFDEGIKVCLGAMAQAPDAGNLADDVLEQFESITDGAPTKFSKLKSVLKKVR